MSNKYLALIQSRVNHQIDELKIRVKKTAIKIRTTVNAYWFKAVMIGIVVWMFLIKDVSINLNLKAKAGSMMAIQQTEQTTFQDFEKARPQNTSLTNRKTDKKSGSKTSAGQEDNLMNTYSNLPFDGNSLELSDSERKKLEKVKKQKAYIKKYADLAKKEMKSHGIPASITLAQGLLESNAGESRLAKNNHNHFGLKCFSRKCKKGHCSNFTDDSHKDFF
jgi:flagellum-specific peptidoglycan hydrolase FlgJ